MDSERSQSPSEVDAPYRRRGRPVGKNRVPLSLSERRARNAQYERERRYETSEAMAELADAAKCDPTMNNSDLLASVISQLQRATEIDSSREIEELRRNNDKLIRQVEALEQRLSNLEDNQLSLEDNDKISISEKRKTKSSTREKPPKVFKSKSESPFNSDSSDCNLKWSHDDEDNVDEESQVL